MTIMTSAARQLVETRRLMRLAFYDGLRRKPPSSRAYMPSYVRAVRKKWGLRYNNSARKLLAEIEGYTSWAEMMARD